MNKPTVLVTGAGRGLGRAIAEHFQANGYHVVATDRSLDMLADLADHSGYTIIPLDVTSDDDANAVAEMIQEKIGRLDVVINNAGINAFYAVSEAPPQMTVDTFQINTFGPLRITSACLDLLLASGGRIVNISSESVPLRAPFQCYAASKASLEALSDTIRRELRPKGVHVALIRREP